MRYGPIVLPYMYASPEEEVWLKASRLEFCPKRILCRLSSFDA